MSHSHNGMGAGGRGGDEEEDENGASAKASKPKETIAEAVEHPSVGGYEIYMAGDDDEDEEDEKNADQVLRPKKVKADPAIYRPAGADEDDGILFSTQAGWNRLSIVLRDSGTLKFVKYVSANAKGDRWDITGDIGVEFDDDEDDDDMDGDEDE